VAQLIETGGSRKLYERGHLPTPNVWGKTQFFWSYPELLSSGPVSDGHGIDLLLLLAWVNKELPPTVDEPFVLFHWDLHDQNTLVDRDNNIAG
jgi:hypothetical protein